MPQIWTGTDFADKAGCLYYSALKAGYPAIY